MEDTIIIKQHYIYMFRVDLSRNVTSKLQIEEFLDKYDFSHYHGAHEIGETTQKPHYQMAIWREHKALSGELSKMRNWWRGKTNSLTHGVAITSGRKIKSLVSYSSKDMTEDNILSNLNQNQLQKIPEWKNKSLQKIENLERLEKALESFDKNLTNYSFLSKLNTVYLGIYVRPLMHRNTYIKYLYKYGYISSIQLIDYVFNINEFNKHLPGNHYRQDNTLHEPQNYITKDYTLFDYK